MAYEARMPGKRISEQTYCNQYLGKTQGAGCSFSLHQRLQGGKDLCIMRAVAEALHQEASQMVKQGKEW